ncbi:MAG: branched-chain amino acid ABC transporter permease [Actinomycetota bacterium]|nr:branched-chain amino acid ABC transporter permease [Actinomycetota bacterium]MDH5224229.1 branched-chain amino acid ABC transporter permease [Actinomycetota bacterium]MDH5313759.1 branched-chain amino acid ABC transporter permease [Actinomycetota bacterium]
MRAEVRIGAIAGVVTIFLAAVGLIGDFTNLNLIGEQVTFAGLMLVLPPLLAGYVATTPRIEAGQVIEATRARAAMVGAVTGASAGVVFAAFVVFVDVFGVERVRAIFLNISPVLMDFLLRGRPVLVAAAILVAISTISGTAGASYRVLPDAARRPLGTAVWVTLLFGFLQRIIPIALDQLDVERDWLYSKVTRGLTWPGAIIVAALAAGASVLKQHRGAAMRRAVSIRPSSDGGGPRLTPVNALLLLVGLAVVFVAPHVVGSVISEVLGTIMVFALLGIGLNIVVGYAGLLDLGYVFFFTLGAYSLALLTGATLNTFVGSSAPVIALDLNFYVAIPVVVAIAAFAGVLIGAPVLRLRGDYLALVTLGLGEMIVVLVTSPWLTPLVGGPQGMRDITNAAIGNFGFRDPKHFYYLAFAFVALALFVSWRLANSRIGRAWTALREDEQVADAMGVSTTSYKLLAFAMGGAIGSVGGALFAVKIGSLTPASFTVLVSIQVLGIVILGGIGSLPGVITGSLVLVGLPGLLREFEEYRLLAYGAALVAVMLLRPQGLVPNVRRSRELHEEDREQDKWAGDIAADEHVAPGISPLGEGAG